MVSAIILRSASAVDEGGITPARNEQASSDEQLLKLWLHGRGPNTQRAYRGDVARFLTFAAKPLQAVTLADLQDFADTLTGLAPASQCRVLSSVKSLLSFGHRIGYLAFEVGRPLRLPANRNRLSERILAEGVIHEILALEPGRRNRALLRLLYAAGLRVFELCALTWQHLQERDNAGQLTVFGKGGKTRTVLLSAATWQGLVLPIPLAFLFAGGLLMYARGTDPRVDPSQVPACKEYERLSGTIPQEKLKPLQQECDDVKASLRTTPARTISSVLPTVVPGTPPPIVRCDQLDPSTTPGTCVYYGLLDSREPPPGYKSKYLVSNTWYGSEVIVYAGSLYADESQGVIIVTERNLVSGGSSFLGEYRTTSKEGRLRITAANGNLLDLITSTGTEYTFDVGAMALAPK